jgi:hypothetical protein
MQSNLETPTKYALVRHNTDGVMRAKTFEAILLLAAWEPGLPRNNLSLLAIHWPVVHLQGLDLISME